MAVVQQCLSPRSQAGKRNLLISTRSYNENSDGFTKRFELMLQVRVARTKVFRLRQQFKERVFQKLKEPRVRKRKPVELKVTGFRPVKAPCLPKRTDPAIEAKLLFETAPTDMIGVVIKATEALTFPDDELRLMRKKVVITIVMYVLFTRPKYFIKCLNLLIRNIITLIQCFGAVVDAKTSIEGDVRYAAVKSKTFDCDVDIVAEMLGLRAAYNELTRYLRSYTTIQPVHFSELIQTLRRIAN